MSTPDYDATVGETIRQLRGQRGLRQADVIAGLRARGLEMLQQTLVKIEQGTRPLRLREAHLIAEVLGVEVQALASGAGTMPAEIAALMEVVLDIEDMWKSLIGCADELAHEQAQLETLVRLAAAVGHEVPVSVQEAAAKALLLPAKDVAEMSRAATPADGITGRG